MLDKNNPVVQRLLNLKDQYKEGRFPSLTVKGESFLVTYYPKEYTPKTGKNAGEKIRRKGGWFVTIPGIGNRMPIVLRNLTEAQALFDVLVEKSGPRPELNKKLVKIMTYCDQLSNEDSYAKEAIDLGEEG